MSLGCVRWMLGRTVRSVCGASPAYRMPASKFTVYSEGCKVTASSSWRCSPFSTAVDDTEETSEPKKKKHSPKASSTISSAGRLIPQREIQVISETGEDLGTMHRSDAMRMMDERGLKLVLLNDNKDPAVYQLMSGKQIHEEQLKLREKKKGKSAPVQMKELTFTAGITAHDLSTKLKHVESMLEKKHHIKITLRAARGRPADDLEANLEQIVQKMETMVGFVSKPKAVRDGRAASCILRPLSAKELSQHKKNTASMGALSEDSQNKTSPVSSPGTKGETIEQ
ncbi:translation initiation factor IF-3, mitochondrial [Halichoeres trimaculatus]|uniref:translation initiation factor IF-3, mitochondrial n=1 Tax=Halichoeres trimaculatus TaxID=147232 RepID=UPI003D9E4221